MRDFDSTQRLINAVLGIVACALVLMAVFIEKHGRGEALGMVGGALVCIAVSFGSLGFLLGWPSVLWLPFMGISLLYIIIGRTWQIVRHYRGRHAGQLRPPVHDGPLD